MAWNLADSWFDSLNGKYLGYTFCRPVEWHSHSPSSPTEMLESGSRLLFMSPARFGFPIRRSRRRSAAQDEFRHAHGVRCSREWFMRSRAWTSGGTISRPGKPEVQFEQPVTLQRARKPRSDVHAGTLPATRDKQSRPVVALHHGSTKPLQSGAQIPGGQWRGDFRPAIHPVRRPGCYPTSRQGREIPGASAKAAIFTCR